MDAAARRRWHGKLPGAVSRLPMWPRLRTPERLPVRLHRNRIYILPTRAGLGFGVLLVAMLLGALNYQNNAALLLTCLLGTTLAASMLIAWRDLQGLTLQAVHADHAFCGERMTLHLAFEDDGRARRGLRIAVDERQQACPLQPGATQATINVPADRRGWRALPRMCLSSSLPFGLFRAWGWITPDLRVLVYPRVGEDGAPPSRNDDPRERLPGGDEFAGLRDYRQGDALRHVAWKASARRGDLLVREFDRAAPGSPLRFDWFALPGVPREPRISRLTGWVCDAYAAAHPWILVLEDGRTFGPAMDAAHYHRCLAALAELP